MLYNNENTMELINLGNIPLANNLKSSKEESLNSTKYPLRIITQENLCFHLDTIVDPTEMFVDYLYRSSINVPYIHHAKKMWHDIKNLVDLNFEKINIVDIGGNDGTLLRTFKSEINSTLTHIKYINVDPSRSFIEDNQKDGINYIQCFWGDVILPEKANIIISTNVFQHNSDVHKFLKGIQDNLDGIWVLEFPYLLQTLKTNQFDQIYHEHYFYWLITPLEKLFTQYGLNIVDITEHDIHGGTIRMVMTNKKVTTSNICEKYKNKEKNLNYEKWKSDIELKIDKDRNFILNLKGTIACFGAAAKGCIYLNVINEICDKISYIVDDTIEKQGKYMPGTHLQIVNRNVLYNDQPDYLIILAHNFKKHIIDSLIDNYNGTIIVMLPEIEIYKGK